MQVEFIAVVQMRKVGPHYTYYIKIPKDVVSFLRLQGEYKGWKGDRVLVRISKIR